ncbi:outer membrane autotransporter protein [Fluviicoccus keumensis]|uniref:Outer membrane autotransporter protein n=1 Tax=Fluviicoccus keumensis TaxID=1435465 RepID=A0A4Q7Z4B3_9GAMM|nr:porin family protein [Fluviicoccus keumensis]RZU45088.1 outer membrane autotransporter protein [Fluviicoccus keumensis]
MIKQLGLALVACTSLAAYADVGDSYFGVDLMKADYQEDGMSESVSPKLIQVKFGSEFASGVGAEFRIGTGINEGEGGPMKVVTPFGTATATAKVNIDLLAGAYLRGDLPFTDQFHVYGLAGITSIKTTADVNVLSPIPGTNSASSTGTEFSYGAGLAFKPADDVSLTAEYMMLVDNGDVQISSFNIGFAKNF